MIKNKLGFTLIELLAVLVLLGVLSALSLPVIMGVINNSRNKMYITDAKRLVAQAEYQLNASSSDIIKPEEGDCIAISLSYLNTPSISVGPGGGKYDLDSSYVVIVNREGELEYLVTLVEKLKQGTYKGVPLMRSESLSTTNRKLSSEIVGFTRNTLVDIDSIDVRYINQKIKEDFEIEKKYDNTVEVISNYVTGNLVQAYHYQELKDITSSGGGYTPVIKSIELESRGAKNYGSLNATLVLKVTDADTPREDLQVSISTSGFDAQDAIIYSYGKNVFSSMDVNFANFGYTYQGTQNVSLYVTIKDPDNNSVKQIVDYTIHPNEAPTIIQSSLSSKNIESNPFLGVLHLSVYDDLDNNTSLQVCMVESKDAESCSNYQSYASLFVLNNEIDYTFHCNGTCRKDGLLHYLKVFIKDSSGAVTQSDAFPFAFPLDEELYFDGNVTVTSKQESFTSTGSKNIIVNAKLKSPSNGVNICISASNTDEVCYPYSSTNQYNYTINSSYDGLTKNVYVYAKKSDGLISRVQTVSYKIYQDKGPRILVFDIQSDENPCTHTELCPNQGGGIHTLLNIQAEDDLSSNSELKLCVSENENDCQNTNNFKSYNDYKNGSFTISGPYDGENREVYLSIRDGMGNISKTSTSYKVYLDRNPILKSDPSVRASSNMYDANILDLYYYTGVLDDLDNQLTYQICYRVDSSSFTCKEGLMASTGVFHLTKDFFTNGPDDYNGQVLTIYSNVKDSYHDEYVRVGNVFYTLYSDKVPEITKYSIKYDNLDATVSFAVTDYMDQYQIGITENGNCNSVSYLETIYDGNDTNTHSISYHYAGSVSSTTLCVKDKKNHVVQKSVTPVSSSQYTTCSSVDTNGARYQYSPVNEEEKISKSRCNSTCYAYNPITNETNSITGRYNRIITYKDAFQQDKSCPMNDVYTANCSFVDCFVKNSNTYYQAIGVVPYEDEVAWSYELNGVTYIHTYHYKAYQATYQEGDKNVTLTEIENKKISPALVLNENSMRDYVRVVDQ